MLLQKPLKAGINYNFSKLLKYLNGFISHGKEQLFVYRRFSYHYKQFFFKGYFGLSYRYPLGTNV